MALLLSALLRIACTRVGKAERLQRTSHEDRLNKILSSVVFFCRQAPSPAVALDGNRAAAGPSAPASGLVELFSRNLPASAGHG